MLQLRSPGAIAVTFLVFGTVIFTVRQSSSFAPRALPVRRDTYLCVSCLGPSHVRVNQICAAHVLMRRVVRVQAYRQLKLSHNPAEVPV